MFLKICVPFSTTRLFFAFAIVFVILLTKCNSERSHKEDELVQYRDGDILLGGLMIIHQQKDNKQCSAIQEVGVQGVETMNMVIDQVNNDSSILPGIKLGTIMVDTCKLDSHAVKEVITKMLPYVWRKNYGGSACTSQGSENSQRLFAGVVGAGASSVSIQVAKVLPVYSVSQISYWSTNPELSDKERYKYFFRTLPPDFHQARAIIDLMKQKKWNYISVVYEQDFYGFRGYEEIKKIADREGICIAVAEPVKNNARGEDFTRIVQNLLRENATVVIVFSLPLDAKRVIQKAHEMAPGRFMWIASDGWAGILPEENDEDHGITFDGAIGFQPYARDIEQFNTYFTNITLGDALKAPEKNPWFPEYISKRNNCTLPNDTSIRGLRKCSMGEQVSKSFGQVKLMEKVANAVLAFVYALHEYHKVLCEGSAGMCAKLKAMNGTNQLAANLYPYLRNISFVGINGVNFTFDDKQDAPAIYSILEYRNDKKINTGRRIDKWSYAGKFEIDSLRLENLTGKGRNIESVCHEPCSSLEATIWAKDSCCFTCQKCTETQIVGQNGTACITCLDSEKPNKEKTTCISLPIEQLHGTTLATVLLAIAGFGALVTVVVSIVYIIHRKSAIVKASGQELCMFILFGVLLVLSHSIAITSTPNAVTCSVARIILAFGPTFMYTGLLTKTMRVMIIFRSKILKPKIKLFLRPMAQICLAFVIVLVQGLVVAIWFIASESAENQEPYGDVVVSGCKHLSGFSVIVGLIYPFVLILVCTVLATINRRVPTGFNEAQLIGFTMYTTCIIWATFLPVFLVNSPSYIQRSMAVSISLSLSACTVLFCLFGPRCYTILFHPDENTPQSVMTSTRPTSTTSSTPNNKPR